MSDHPTPPDLPPYAAEVLQDHDRVLPALAAELADTGEDIDPMDLHATDAELDAAGGTDGSPHTTDRALARLGALRADVDAEPVPDMPDVLAQVELALVEVLVDAVAGPDGQQWRVGDPDTITHNADCCQASRPAKPAYLCSLEIGHAGRHVASDGEEIVAVWSPQAAGMDPQRQAVQSVLAALRAAQVFGATLIVPASQFATWVHVLGADHFQAHWVSILDAVHVWIDQSIDGRRLAIVARCAEITGHTITEGAPPITIPASAADQLVAPTTEGGAR